MADVHLFSVENNAKTLINYPMSSIASTTSPLQTPHDSSFFFNSFSEHIPDAMETLAWQQLVPDQHLPFSSPLPSLNYALALTLPEMGYDPNHDMGEGALLRELAFSLDLAKENNTLQAAIIAASPHVAATSSPPENLSSFCTGRSSQFGDYCVGIPDKLAMALKKENMKAFSPPCTAEESGGKTMHPTYQREEEHPEVSCSSGFNAVQKPKNAYLKRGTAEKKRKAVEDKITDVPSCITCVHQQAAPKKPKAEEVKIKGHKSSERIDKAEESKKKAESNSSGNSGSSRQMHAKENATQAEPPKQDFIHVRARRGQATDSHSLAERVRREKISERMKVLQDLVPGCSKVSGKAVMLDEIINYVQSLQHQVEFLSMRLASVNSRLNISLDGMFRKEMLQGHIIPSPYGFDQELLPNFSLITSAQAKLNQLGDRCTGGLDSMSLISTQGNTAKRSTATMLNSNIFGDVNSQISSVWDELQNPYQIGRLTHDNYFTGKSDFEDQMRAKHLLKTELK